MARLRRGQRRGTRNGPPRAALPEARLVERLTLAEHVVNRAPQSRRQDRQRLGLAALRLLLLLPLLGALAAAQEQARRLAEGPAQMRIADLLAGRLVGAAHQSRVRHELTDVVEAPHFVQFVEQD